jgi:hypothetical protein
MGVVVLLAMAGQVFSGMLTNAAPTRGSNWVPDKAQIVSEANSKDEARR